MTLLQNWRKFTFFDRDVLKDPDNQEQNFSSFQDLNIVCCQSGNGHVFLGEKTGGIYVVDKKWTITNFKAYEIDLLHLCYVRQHEVLVTVGNDDPGINPLLKVWRYDKVDKQGKPFCSRITKCSANNRPVKVSSLAVHSSLQFFAIGFEDSTLLLYKGDVVKERFSSRAHTLRDGLTCSAEGSINGLAFHGTTKNLTLFVVTQHLVLAYALGAKEQEQKSILDRHGCLAKCWALGDAEIDSQLIIAKNDAVYCYQPPDLRSQCFIFEGDKIMIKSAGCYLVVVAKDVGPSSIRDEASVNMNMVTIYDITNSFIAYSAPIPEVVHLFFEWGSFYVISKNGKVYQLKEKDMKTKLEILFRKNLYDVAISLAKKQSYDEEKLSGIYKLYGDYLYNKNDFGNAVRQYVRTIGKLEPSYVIRKFLDAQRVPQLMRYLEELHKLGLATEDHTTILLNCYAKLSDSAKLQQFVKSSAKEVYFDVDTAIKVLRNANYKDDALFLARLHKRHDSALQILLEDKKQYLDALNYIKELDFDQADDAMKQYGKMLLAQVPDEATSLLKQLCTGFSSHESGDDKRAPADQFIHIFVNDTKRLREFLEHMIMEVPDCQPIMYNTLLELYLRENSMQEAADNKLKKQRTIMEFLENPMAKYEWDHALILSQQYGFSAGMLYIYEKANLLPQIIQHHMSERDYAKVIEICKKYGSEESGRDIWLQTLWFFARNDDCPAQLLGELLQEIDKQKYLPPLMVLEILSSSPCVTLATVKQYLLTWLRNETDQIQKDEAQIEQYKQEIERTESLIETLKNGGQVFQVSKCTACDHQLEVPTVHFLCKHSYHQHCYESYAENENECPACSPQNKKLRMQMLAQAQGRDSYSQLKMELQTAKDTMGVVADYFGRGMFQQTSPAMLNLSSKLAQSSAMQPLLPSVPQPTISVPSAEAENPFEDNESTNPFDVED